MALDYTALVTVDQVRKAMLGSGGKLADQLADDTSEEYEACEAVILDVTDDIERYLHRKLIVRHHTFVYRDTDWKARLGYRNADGHTLFSAWARQWPVVEVVDVDTDASFAVDVTIQDSSNGGQLLSYGPESLLITDPPYQLRGFAGFRRQDHVDLATLLADEGADDLATLTVLPPLLPGKIRRTALRLVISELRQQVEGVVGVASRSKRIDNMTVESRTTGAALYIPGSLSIAEKEMSALSTFRYLARGG